MPERPRQEGTRSRAASLYARRSMAALSGTRVRHTVSFEEAFRVELLHFRDCVLGGKPPHTNLTDALGDARLIQSIARSFA